MVEDAPEDSVCYNWLFGFDHVVVTKLRAVAWSRLITERDVNPYNACSEIDILLKRVFIIVIVEHADLDRRR